MVKPEFIWNVAGVWFELFATMEWMKARSSTCSARWGKSSLTQRPLPPRRSNRNGLFISLPGFPKKGSSFPLPVSS